MELHIKFEPNSKVQRNKVYTRAKIKNMSNLKMQI